jgi:hypothetical protein
MKRNVYLITLISVLICIQLSIDEVYSQTAYAVDFPNDEIISFDLSDPSTTTHIATTTTNFLGGTWASNDWYVTDFSTWSLGKINPVNGNYTFIAFVPNDVYYLDLAYDNSTNTMYAIGTLDFQDFKLYSVNLSTGWPTTIGVASGGGAMLWGLACDLAGNLYTTDGMYLYSLNKTNATLTSIGYLNVYFTDIPSLEFDNTNNVLYLSGLTEYSSDLYTVNPLDGSTAYVGSFPEGNSEVIALGIPYGTTTLTNDIGLQSIVAPNTGYNLTASEPVTVRVLNTGTATQSNIPISYTLNGGLPVNEIIPGPVAGGAQLDYTFNQTTNLSAIQAYDFSATANLSGDQNPDNNNVTKQVVNQGVSHDLAALSIAGPTSPYQGTIATYTVNLKNVGLFTEEGSSYSVILYDNNNAVIGTSGGVTITPGEKKSVSFNVSFNILGVSFINAKVFLTGDMNSLNDKTPDYQIYVQPASTGNTPGWQLAGLSGGTVYAFIESENIILAGTNKGIYRSANNGISWEPSGLEGITVSAFEKVDNYLFVGVNSVSHHVYRSSDKGFTWSPADNGLPAYAVMDFASIGPELFVGMNNGAGNPVYRSSDYGQTWVPAYNGVSFTQINELESCGSYLFAGSPFAGLFRSSDLGATWQNIVPNQFIQDIEVLGNIVFYCTYGGVYRSADFGNTWTHPENHQDIAMAVNGTDVYTGNFGSGPAMFRSSDGGLTWAACNPVPADDRAYTLYGTGTAVLGSTLTGLIYRTDDNGNSWQNSSTGIQEVSLKGTFASGNNVFASAGTGVYGMVYKASASVADWNWEMLSILDEKVVSVQKVGSGLMATSQFLQSGNSVHKLYLSMDDGTTWIDIHLKSDTIANYGVVGSTVLATSNTGGIYSTYRSSDFGNTWQIVTYFGSSMVGGFQTSGNIIFASKNPGIHCSLDFGATWTLSGLETLVAGGPFSLGTIGSNIFIGLDLGVTKRGLYRSSDNGSSWTMLNNTLGVESIIAAGTKVLVTAKYFPDPYGMNYTVENYISLDNGTTLTNISSNLANANTRSSSATPTRVFLGKSQDGVFCSQDNGSNWININEGFNPSAIPNVVSTAISGNYVIAASEYQSLWRRQLSELNPPAQPSVINGPAAPCIGSSQTYSVANVAGVTYNWQVPSNWTINSGSGIHTIDVTVGSFPGIVLVTPSNEFGIGPAQYLIVNPNNNPPAQPSLITGPVNPESGTSQEYSVVNEPGVTYAWTFPSGWVQTGGGTTNAVTVTVGTSAGTIQVTPSTPCGVGTPRALEVVPTALPLNIKLVLEGAYFSADDPLMTNNLNNLLPLY